MTFDEFKTYYTNHRGQFWIKPEDYEWVERAYNEGYHEAQKKASRRPYLTENN